jgi:N-acetylmuramoyl-L-alanine amidase
MSKLGTMKSIFAVVGALLFASILASAQQLTRSPGPASSRAPTSGEAAQIEALVKKIDEQNAKIDMLSQQILKLEQQLSSSRPGVMVGEATPAPAATAPAMASAPAVSPSLSPAPNGNSHVVARGETLTSISKQYSVSVSDLQKFNHIENPLKLQAGQTIMIPTSPTPTPTPGE